MMNKLLLSLTLSALSFLAFSQEITVSGSVKNEKNETMPYVSVKVKGKNTGVLTDLNGNYSVKLVDSTNVFLIFSYSGYTKQEIRVAKRTVIDVVLVTDAQVLDEVVAVGYGEAKSKEVTGATGKVKGEDIEKLNVSRMDQALQGQVSGVTISTNSGSPGGASNIRIRGISTFGDNDPLILVDGVVYDSEGLNALNPSDIKSINVLKDATAGI